MAGKFVTILNPGYSTLFTRDLTAASTDNVENSTSMNLFNPDVAHPLQEGEWLTIGNETDGTAGKFVRPEGGDVNAVAPAAGSALSLVDNAANTLASGPCFMYFQERGRYDAQLTRKAHCITGPAGFEFRTKMIVCASGDEGELVYVATCEDSSNRLVSALVSSSAIADSSAVNGGAAPAAGDGVWYAGVIVTVHGTNDATVLFQPGFVV